MHSGGMHLRANSDGPFGNSSNRLVSLSPSLSLYIFGVLCLKLKVTNHPKYRWALDTDQYELQKKLSEDTGFSNASTAAAPPGP
mmetsp:Transcript_30260/g.41025  ORF Transcript_30260/g.41025 Transcript_30260/m.41025 type:complete len:84 (-) Transcript_30260:456-707(-)